MGITVLVFYTMRLVFFLTVFLLLAAYSEAFGFSFFKKRKEKKAAKAAAAKTHKKDIGVAVTPQEIRASAASGAFCIDARKCKKTWQKNINGNDVDSNSWMKGIDSKVVPARDLTIPGTHDTFSLSKDRGNFKAILGAIPGIGSSVTTNAADNRYTKKTYGKNEADPRKGGNLGYEKGEVEANLVITQVFNFEEQPNLGIRAFDLRCIPDKEHKGSGLIRFTHNHIMQPFYLHLELNNALSWLEEHPSEFIIFKYKGEKGLKAKDIKAMISQEGLCGPKICSQAKGCLHSQCIWEDTNSGGWSKATLGQLRGRVVFWPKKDKITKATAQKGMIYSLQKASPGNAVSFGTGGGKNVIKALTKYWDDAWAKQKASRATAGIFMFYLSATGSVQSFGPVCMATGQKCGEDYDNPENGELYYGLNNMMHKHLRADTMTANLGLVMMDFPGHSLVCKLIESNYRRL